MNARVVRVAAPTALFVLALARLLFGDPFELGRGETTPAAPDHVGPAITPAARAALDGLAAGDALAAFEVVRVAGPEDGAIVVELSGADGHGARVWVVRHGARGDAAFLTASGFDLFYGAPPPGQAAASEDRMRAAVEALGARIEAAGADPDAAGL